MTITLALNRKNPSRLLDTIREALAAQPSNLRVELVGPGFIVPDHALMLFHALRNRPATTRLHIHSHTCLSDGAILVWLAGDSRSIRPDAWIQLSGTAEPDIPLPHPLFPSAIPLAAEYPSETDLRSIHTHLDEFLPVHEIAGLRLLHADLADLALLSTPGEADPLDLLLSHATDQPQHPSAPEFHGPRTTRR